MVQAELHRVVATFFPVIDELRGATADVAWERGFDNWLRFGADRTTEELVSLLERQAAVAAEQMEQVSEQLKIMNRFLREQNEVTGSNQCFQRQVIRSLHTIEAGLMDTPSDLTSDLEVMSQQAQPQLQQAQPQPQQATPQLGDNMQE